MSTYTLGWGGTAWTGNAATNFGVAPSGTFVTALSDGSTGTWVQSSAASASFNIYSSQTATGLIPASATITSVDTNLRQNREAGTATWVFVLASTDSGGVVSSVTDSVAATGSIATKTINWPTAPGGSAWTAEKFFNLAGTGNSQGYLQVSKNADPQVFAYDLAHILSFTLATPTVGTPSVTGYTISARVSALLSLSAGTGATTLSRVRYGTTPGVYPSTFNGTTYTADFSGNEVIVVTGLSTSTTYYGVFDLINADATVTSSEFSFTTAAGDAMLMQL